MLGWGGAGPRKEGKQPAPTPALTAGRQASPSCLSQAGTESAGGQALWGRTGSPEARLSRMPAVGAAVAGHPPGARPVVRASSRPGTLAGQASRENLEGSRAENTTFSVALPPQCSWGCPVPGEGKETRSMAWRGKGTPLGTYNLPQHPFIQPWPAGGFSSLVGLWPSFRGPRCDRPNPRCSGTGSGLPPSLPCP